MNWNWKRFLKINFGVMILAAGLYYFLIPANLAVGGVTGFAMVVNKFFPILPIGAVMLVVNILLFILAFLIIGKEFGGYTIYSSVCLSGIIYVLESLTPMNKPFVDDILLNLIYGIIISGIGMGVIFYQNASTGGTDIIAKIINKYTHIDIGKSLLASDFVITLMAGLAFGAKLGMYALMGIIVNSLVIDNIIAGFNTKLHMMIISECYEEINRFILDEIQRGTTLYHAEGGHSRQDKVIIHTIVSKREYIRIKNWIRFLDPKAFVSLNFVNEVLGEGFIED